MVVPVDESILEQLGDPGLVADLLETFLVDTARIVAILDGGDLAASVRVLHELKSTTANIGALPLSQIVRELEHAAKQGAPLHRAAFDAELGRVHAHVTAWIARLKA